MSVISETDLVFDVVVPAQLGVGVVVVSPSLSMAVSYTCLTFYMRVHPLLMNLNLRVPASASLPSGVHHTFFLDCLRSADGKLVTAFFWGG